MADDTLRELAAYREAWRAACDPRAGPVDLDALLGDAEALSGDVILSRVLDVIARMLPQGAPWPLPGVRRLGPGEFAADWAAFGAIAERGTAEDQCFWHAAAMVADEKGDPAWLGATVADGGKACVRLGEMPWAEIAAALGRMEAAPSPHYARHGLRLTELLVETIAGIGRGPICGCVRGDAAAGLGPLAAAARREQAGTPARRALTKAAAGALEALRSGGEVRWLRDAPGAPPTGCGAGTR